MGEKTKIGWCDHTASPWHGCTEVSTGCDHCYAAALSKRNPAVLGEWGDEGTRVKSKSFIKNLELWNKKAEKTGKPTTVFPSLCDPFEDRPELIPWRIEMFEAADRLPWIRLLLLTKRPENILKMWPETGEFFFKNKVAEKKWFETGEIKPEDTIRNHRDNVFLLTSVENQKQAEIRIPELLKCRNLAPVLGLSCEPLLGEVDLYKAQALAYYDVEQEIIANIDWVIAGGESGPNARPMHPDWAKSLRDQCEEADVPFFFKQWGEWVSEMHPEAKPNEQQIDDRFVEIVYDDEGNREDYIGRYMCKIGKEKAGNELDGKFYEEFPDVK